MCWLAGPAAAVLLVTFTLAGNAGPGFALLVVAVAAPGLIIVAPLIQFGLLRTATFRGRYAAACGTALLWVAALVWVATLTGRFNFW